MKTLVTGGAGFIGSHIVDRLIAEGHDVIIIDNFLTGEEKNVNPKARLIHADITDFDSIASHVAGVETVFHTAAVARAAWGFEKPVLTAFVNVTGTVNVLEAARKAGVRRFVHSSSYAIEQPINPYNVSKLAAENFVLLYNKLYGLSTIALRYANVYGPRQSEKGEGLHIFTSFRRSKREDGKIWITGDGTQARDFIHVRDIVHANMRAMKSDATGHIDIVTGKNTTLNDAAKIFNCPIEYRPAKVGDPLAFHPDPEPASKILGFRATVPLEEGIKDVLENPSQK